MHVTQTTWSTHNYYHYYYFHLQFTSVRFSDFSIHVWERKFVTNAAKTYAIFIWISSASKNFISNYKFVICSKRFCNAITIFVVAIEDKTEHTFAPFFLSVSRWEKSYSIRFYEHASTLLSPCQHLKKKERKESNFHANQQNSTSLRRQIVLFMTVTPDY